jgi:tyrosinase
VLIGTASTVVAGAVGLPYPGEAEARYVRQSIADFSDDPAKVAAFRAGVAMMKGRGLGNPTSWAYQANMHGVPAGTPLRPQWATCDHGTWFFFPWHRMYLYWFERILRRASGDPNFALPYWDYSDPSQRLLPLIFRQPASTSNPLFEPRRRSSFNAGTRGLSSFDVDSSEAFRQTRFASRSLPYGFGGYPKSFSHSSGNHGALESSPHDNVHVAIGGHMGDVARAARDPIFWLHHANIDRLWNRWLSMRRTNPTSSNWLGQRFTFFNERGRPVTESVQQFLTTRAAEYAYDTEGALARSRIIGSSSATEEAAITAETILARWDRQVRLGARPVSVQLAPTEVFNQQSTRSGQVLVAVSKIGSKAPPGSAFDVYLNLPAGTAPDPALTLFFVGRLSFFGRSVQSHAHSLPGEEPAIRAFDVTALARRQAESGVWRRTPAITIAAVYPEDLDEAAVPNIGDIELIRR